MGVGPDDRNSSASAQNPEQMRILYSQCPLCDGEKVETRCIADCSAHPLYHPALPPKIIWKRCCACEHVFTDGYFCDEALNLVFSKTHENQTPGHDFENQRRISAKMVEQVARHQDAGRWLDVGFGNGSLLFTAQEWGFETIGLDLRPSSVALMRQMGFETHCIELESFKTERKLSVISMADVLEHMPFPKQALITAAGLLEPNGILFLSMPSYDTTAWRLLDKTKSNPYWGELEHYHNFSRKRLYDLLDEAGFTPVSYSISERYRVGMEIIARLKTPIRQPDARGSSQIFSRAFTLHKAGKTSEAKELYENILRHDPNHSDTLNNAGLIAFLEGNSQKAEDFFRKAIDIRPDDAAFHFNYGFMLQSLSRFEEALASYRQALAIKPDYFEAHSNSGVIFRELRRYTDAITSYQRALAIKPNSPQTHNHMGAVLFDLKRFQEALTAYEKAIQLKTGYFEALFNQGAVFTALKEYEKAFESYEKAMDIKPDCEWLRGLWLHLRMQISEWRDFESIIQEFEKKLRNNSSASTPFHVLAALDDAALQLASARRLTEMKYPNKSSGAEFPRKAQGEKIRIGYFSADFHNHATAYLMSELFASHDRDKFEIIAISFGPDARDAMRARLKRSFDKFIDVRDNSDEQIATLARSLSLDIAVDLKGFTEDSRTGVFAYRCAPVQVNYLGYPGTMGADYIDYIIADHIVIPPQRRRFFDEKIVYLPNSYQVNDSKRAIADQNFTRTELGLPASGFVFCSFNNSYKILPATFASWIRILNAVEGSVLWLLDANDASTKNLKREAASRGLSPERLVFAKRMPLAEHLARHRCADLFLDTLPCNAHTTASDALWAGLPVLTRMGESFASRVAASLLNAVGMPELIATTPADYEAIAIRIGRTPEELERLKRKLSDMRLTSKLFDTKLYVKHIEAAYIAMHEHYKSGLPPDHIFIEDQRNK